MQIGMPEFGMFGVWTMFLSARFVEVTPKDDSLQVIGHFEHFQCADLWAASDGNSNVWIQSRPFYKGYILFAYTGGA
jgi:hypothetical protein